MASINSLIFGKGYPSSMVTALSPIVTEYIWIVPSFFFTIDILAEYELLLEQIIPLLSKSYISCFIFLCMFGLKVFSFAVMRNGCIKLILCLKTLVLSRSLLCWATTFLNWSNSLFTKIESYLSTCLTLTEFSARCKQT